MDVDKIIVLLAGVAGARYLRNRSTARNFVKKQATVEDLQELENFTLERRDKLSEEK
ncbi:hypothetical protein [Shouchella patagoniensis]|uniref:hypothetical protein n=1 Tax=Shouchella patagoniensis TaxID=228576 RepID=UPI0014739E73|nr:hypothetical protein [Shouchella patagoniensis]